MIGHWLLARLLGHWKALAALSWLVCGTLYLTLPPSPDQFNHAYMAWRMLAGDIPYRDLIDENWPGVLWLHMAAVWAFGVNLWSWRAFDYLLFAASALFLADLVRATAGRDAARLSLILSPLMYATATQWIAGQHDMSAAQFLVGALWFHIRGYTRRAWMWQLGTGVFLGAAMLNKPTVGAFGLLLPLHAVAFRVPLAPVIAHTAAAASATLSTLAAAIAAVLSHGTQFAEFFEAVYTYNAAAYLIGTKTFTELLFRVPEVHAVYWPALALASVPALWWMLRATNRSLATTSLPLLWIAGVLSFFLQFRGPGYHLAACFMAIAGAYVIFIVAAANGGFDTGGRRWRRTLDSALIALALAWFPYKVATAYRWVPMALAAGDYGRYLARFTGGDDISVADAVAFARRLNEIPGRGCVFVVGTVSSINYLAQRPQPTRFYYFTTLANAERTPLAGRWIALWQQDLEKADCRLALVARVARAEWLAGPTPAAAALRRFLDRYEEAGRLGAEGAIQIYERKKPAAP